MFINRAKKGNEEKFYQKRKVENISKKKKFLQKGKSNTFTKSSTTKISRI